VGAADAAEYATVDATAVAARAAAPAVARRGGGEGSGEGIGEKRILPPFGGWMEEAAESAAEPQRAW
jgi:hypothetical protein